MLSAARRTLGRWYVAAAALTAAGVAVGYFAFFSVLPGRPQIGVIDIPFTVIEEDSAFVIGEMLDYARRNDSIKGVVVKLVTPGGGVADSEHIYFKMLSLRAKKPVVVSTGWINASGGMLMSMGANYIYAEPASFVGSIGVILSLGEPGPRDELQISSGPAKLTGGTDRTFIGMVEMLKNSFIQTVVSQRGDRLRASPAELSEARLYLGLEALRLGLVDGMGTDADAIEKAASLAGVSNYGLVDVNEKVAREFVLKLNRIFGDTQGQEEPQVGLPNIGMLRTIASAAQRSGDQPGVPPDFPSDVSLPRMYYLYVTPSEE